MLYELIRNTRSIRRFQQSSPVDMETLRTLVELARIGGSARNVQPLKFMLVNAPDVNAKIFTQLGWAGYLKEWPGPEEGERPAAYIICLLDTGLSNEAECDLGIATQNILLGATEKGLGGCRIASFSPKLKEILAIQDNFRILMVVALGTPVEQVFLDECGPGGDIKYWRDSAQVHHVPKRALKEVIIGEIAS
jgi:nitroreductase